MIYTKEEKVVDRALRSTYFSDLDEIGKAYELESRKPRITIRRPFQVGIAVYQLAKLRMLEFYYDFLDKFIDRRDFELIQMDTDSNYMAISAERELVVWQKKKVRLVNLVGCGHIESRPRNSLRRWEECLPECLLDEPLFYGFFRNLGGFS